jgi:hypothetical protein
MILPTLALAHLFARVVIMWLYNTTGRSVLLVGLFHASFNATVAGGGEFIPGPAGDVARDRHRHHRCGCRGARRGHKRAAGVPEEPGCAVRGSSSASRRGHENDANPNPIVKADPWLILAPRDGRDSDHVSDALW